MNSKTKREFIEFLSSIQALAQGVILTTGIETCTDIMSKAESLKIQLEQDETILEVR